MQRCRDTFSRTLGGLVRAGPTRSGSRHSAQMGPLSPLKARSSMAFVIPMKKPTNCLISESRILFTVSCNAVCALNCFANRRSSRINFFRGIQFQRRLQEKLRTHDAASPAPQRFSQVFAFSPPPREDVSIEMPHSWGTSDKAEGHL
jgi:hypothetical protein